MNGYGLLNRLSLGKWVPERPLMVFSVGTKFHSEPFAVEISPQGMLNIVAPSLPNATGIMEPVRVEVPIGWTLEIDSIEFELLKRAVTQLHGQLGAIVQAAPPRKTHVNNSNDVHTSSWVPPPRYVGTKEICTHPCYQKYGKNPPRTTIQTWEALNPTDRIVAPDSGEIFYLKTWVRERIAKWNPQSPRHT